MNNDLIIESVSIRDQVASIIRKMILKGELKGNEQISERQISQKLDVSTTPVKEAFRLLEAEGLIYTKPRSGTFVSNFSKDVMLQIVFMRSALDGVAAYFAAKIATEEEIQLLGQILEEAKALIDAEAPSEEISFKNAMFHEELRNCAQNDYLKNLINSMRNIDNMFRDLALTTEKIELSRSHADHVAIFNAIKGRNAEEAERIINIHIRRVAMYVVESYPN